MEKVFLFSSCIICWSTLSKCTLNISPSFLARHILSLILIKTQFLSKANPSFLLVLQLPISYRKIIFSWLHVAEVFLKLSQYLFDICWGFSWPNITLSHDKHFSPSSSIYKCKIYRCHIIKQTLIKLPFLITWILN